MQRIWHYVASVSLWQLCEKCKRCSCHAIIVHLLQIWNAHGHQRTLQNEKYFATNCILNAQLPALKSIFLSTFRSELKSANWLTISLNWSNRLSRWRFVRDQVIHLLFVCARARTKEIYRCEKNTLNFNLMIIAVLWAAIELIPTYWIFHRESPVDIKW